MSLNSY